MSDAPAACVEPLTLGTAGHVDHGKSALVGALTGVETDRLPEEKARGMSIVLGYAQLELPSGRRLSVVDVPGHERFVRTMVAGATGVDMFLMVVAADDGVMPQTIEHAEVLAALDVREGVVAITKSDLADPAEAAIEASELLPGAPVVICSSREGSGLDELRRAIEEVAARLPSRGAGAGEACLHIDRAFTVAGRGTVVTGTLWSGSVVCGETLELLPARAPVRVRGLEVHDSAVEEARAGQRVAVNIAGPRGSLAVPGDALAAPGSIRETSVLDCRLELRKARHAERVQVHHGTRAVTGRLASLEGVLWQLRLEQPLLARDGDRLVVRRLAPPDTLGGGVVLDAHARRHGRRPDLLEELRRIAAGEPPRRPRADGAAEPGSAATDDAAAAAPPGAPGSAPRPTPAQLRQMGELERRLLDAGPALLSEAQMDGATAALRELRAQGLAVRVSGRLYAHADVLTRVRGEIVALIERNGAVTLAGVRDALGLSRKTAQAFLEHLDAARVTRRLGDDSRVLSRRAAPAGEAVG